MGASAAGSLAVEVEGAMPSMPPRYKIEERLKGEISGEHLFLHKGVIEMKVTTKKSRSFYTQSALSFLKGVEARPAADGRKVIEAKQAVHALRISGMGDACAVAVA